MVWVYVCNWEAAEGEASQLDFSMTRPESTMIAQQIPASRIRDVIHTMLDEVPECLTNILLECHLHPTPLMWEKAVLRLDKGQSYDDQFDWVNSGDE